MADNLCPICGQPLATCECVRDDNGRSIAPKQHPVSSLEDDLYERYLRKIQDGRFKKEEKRELQGEERRGVLDHRQESRDGLPAPDESHREEETFTEVGAL